MKKIVFRNFRYMYCDDFAMFLQEMSEKGYHFCRWGIGLEFEKGQPEKRIYRVEVFNDASELDTKAEEDTLEYGDYCEAAGWTLVDSRKKFCIFRKDRADAPDIVTKEERFFAIRKAEFHLRLVEIGGLLLLSALKLLQFWTKDFTNIAFNNFLLILLAFISIITLTRIICYVKDFIWFKKKEQLIENRETPFYGIETKWLRQLHRCSCLFSALAVIFMLTGCILYFNPKMVWILILFIVIDWSSNLGIAHFRPSRENLFPMRLGISFCIVLFFAILIYYVESNPDTFLEDAITATKNESILGGKYSYDIAENLSDGKISFPQNMTVTIYESPYPRVLEKCVESSSKLLREYNFDMDTTAQWPGAVKVISSELNNIHTVLYPEKVLDIAASEPLPVENYDAILKKIDEIHKKYNAS